MWMDFNFTLYIVALAFVLSPVYYTMKLFGYKD